ncbi:hypothetical protein NDA12_000191 [Ustilago hordei]|nr:hypothetical protein NDA12_000191 [Ustilago hordei]
MGSTRTTTRPKRICCWLPKSEETTCWILDSGVSYHMVNDHKYTCTLVLVDNYSNFIPRDTDRQEAESYPIRSRNQMESNEALEWLLEKGIEWQTTIGYNSRQNG